MDQLHLLWDYQQADVAVGKLESSIKRSPMRQKLVKYRDYLLDQQGIMKRIESEFSAMLDRLEALKDAVAHTEEQLKSLQSRIETEPPVTSDDTAQCIADAKRFLSNITSYEQEIRRIRKDAEDRERLQHDVKVRYAKAKTEFERTKVDYEEESKEKLKELEGLRAVVLEKEKLIDPEHLTLYRTIKQHSVPPLAKLLGDQCGGCNMSLPSVVLRNIRAGKQVECETCGRLIIM